MTRIYHPGALAAHTTVTLNEFASHHLARVLRVAVGEEITVFNGEGGEYPATISAVNKKTVAVDLGEFLECDRESSLDITLAQGISRGEKMDYTIQKAVELGVKTIIPVFTERCNVKLDAERSEKRLQHWQSVIISACEQSGRNRIPYIAAPQSLDNWLPTITADICLSLSPHAVTPLKNMNISSSSRVVLLIGPEGGLSDREMSQAERYHFQPLRLGPRVLRTETAALAAIAALQARFGDM